MPTTEATSRTDVIFYDGVCAMCNGFVRFILPRDRDGHFGFVALQSAAARRLLQRHGQTVDEIKTVYLVTGYQGPDERLLENSTAMLEIFRRLGGIWSVLSCLRVVPTPIRDFAYSLVVKNRYRLFGKYDSCPLPPPQWRDRFVHDDDVAGSRLNAGCP